MSGVKHTWLSDEDSWREFALRDEIKANAKVANDESIDTPPPTEADLMRCGPGLKLILMRMTKDIERANDLAQEVMMSVLQAIRAGRIASVDSLPGYVRETARNAFFSQERRPVVEVSVNELDQEALEQAIASPLDLYERAELQQVALQVLRDMQNERYRELLLGFYVSGKSKHELMAELNLSKVTFDTALSRARLRMSELMKQKLGTRSSMVSEQSNSSVIESKGDKP